MRICGIFRVDVQDEVARGSVFFKKLLGFKEVIPTGAVM
jgi:hypothetical protein